MTHLAKAQIVRMTELRELQKVSDRANGKPVATRKNLALVGYLIASEAVHTEDHRVATMEELMESLVPGPAINRPVLDYLMDQ